MEISSLFDVKDKVVLVTGGSRGIGKMIAEGFIRNGAKVYIASRDAKACAAVATELSRKGPGKCYALPSDLGTEEGCKELAKQLASREKRLDVLINNSGCAWGGDMENHPGKAWDRILSLNLKAPFFLTRDLLPLLDAAATSKDGARVINIGSIAGLAPQAIPAMAYDTSKGAIHHLTRILAAKLARRPNGGHILVNAIAPGLVPTKMSDGIVKVTGLGFEELTSGIPLEKYGTETDMAGLAIFLASNASSWVTGVVIAADGGQIYASETSMTPKL